MTALLPRRRPRGNRPGAARAPEVAALKQEHLQERSRRILAEPLEYRVCRGFKRLHVLCHDFRQPILPDFACRVNERTLLPAEQECDLFVRMNYCKFRADLLRRQLPQGSPVDKLASSEELSTAGDSPDGDMVEETLREIESFLQTATQLRDCLVTAFLKLAISLIGPFVSRRHPFDELLSEAAVALLRAVEKFDPDRGFRFSTYATPAVRRQLERFVLKQHKDQQVLVRTPHLDTVPAAGAPTRSEERRRETAVHALDGMLDRLDAREQLILGARFGLHPGSDPESLQDIAGRLGICRERVRQIESRAIARLRDMPEAGQMKP